MAVSSINRVMQQIRQVVADADDRCESDAALLARFLSHSDPRAIGVLINRHAPMVWGVCRRILLDHHDAEDAFQATFLVLLRKANTIKPRSMAGNWLHGVAFQTALKARAMTMKRSTREKPMATLPEPPARAKGDHPMLEYLDEELNRLPDKYRVVLVLCDLQGKTRAEAAQELGWAEGTVASRLARGRQMLAKRLGRHGAVVSAVALSALFADNAASAAPMSIVATTIQAAITIASARTMAAAGLSQHVIALADGVVKTMLLSKLKLVGVTLTIAVLACFGIGSAIQMYAEEHLAASETSPIRFNEPDANLADQNQPMDGDVKPKGDAGRPIHSLFSHTTRLTSVAYAPDGRWIATASWDGTARLWNAKTGKEVHRVDFPDTKGYNTLHQIAFSPDNAFIVTLVRESTDECVIIVWDRSMRQKVCQLPGWRFAISADGKHIACGQLGVSPFIRLYELATGTFVRGMSGPYSRVDLLTFSPDGKTLYAQVGIPRPQPRDGVTRFGHDAAQVRAWDVATGKERRTGLEGAWDDQGAWNDHHMTLAPDGRTIAVRGLGGPKFISHNHAGGNIVLRETAGGGRRIELTGHTDDVMDAAFSPDGRTLASASMDKTVRLWDLPSGKEIGRLEGHSHWVLSIAFSPDGGTLVSGGLDKTALVWDVSKITRRRGESAERSLAELEADWKDLGGDAAKGYAALGRLISSPKQAVSFLGKHLQSAKTPDTKRIEQLIGNLEDDRFEVREQASKELAALGEWAAPLLQKALAGNPSLEVRRRLDALLDRLDGVLPPAEMSRQLRAVELLESIGNPEARRLLETLAAGPLSRRTQEAKASVDRLACRPWVGP